MKKRGLFLERRLFFPKIRILVSREKGGHLLFNRKIPLSNVFFDYPIS